MENSYRKYFDSLPCYVSVQNKDLKIIDANNRFEQDFGNFRDRYCYHVYKQRPDPCDNCAVEKTFADGQARSSYETVQSIDGKKVEVLINTKPIYDEDGNINAVLEMSTDVSDLIMLQNKLRANEERYRTLFEEVPCFISIQDKDLNIINTNRMFRETFGSTLGYKCYEVYKHRKEACIPCTVKETFEDGRSHRHEEVVTSPDGRSINTIVYTAPILDAKGNISKVIEMSSDITEVRELQDQLTSVGMLISSISHGIKGLLNGLNGGIYLVNKGIESDNKKRLTQGWDIVLRNVNRIKSMVMDILYYAKDREPIWEQVSSLDLVEEVVSVVSDKAKEMNIQLVTEFSDTVGHFDCDRNAIRALLINLIENSIDACRIDKNKEFHKVVFSLTEEDDKVIFSIKDNGIGMDKETKNKAFSLFFSSKGGDGTGLGLFIANKISKAHGGKIKIKSEPHEGSEFRVFIPKRSISLQSKDFK